MERIMELREAMRDGPFVERERAGALRAVDDQSYTDSCPPCTGLLIHEWCYDLLNEGEHNAQVLRCVQCGYRIDPVILQNTTLSDAQICAHSRYVSDARYRSVR